MAKTAAVYGRVDPVVKAEVDNILKALGVSQSTLIQMVYNEIYLTKKILLLIRYTYLQEKC